MPLLFFPLSSNIWLSLRPFCFGFLLKLFCCARSYLPNLTCHLPPDWICSSKLWSWLACISETFHTIANYYSVRLWAVSWNIGWWEFFKVAFPWRINSISVKYSSHDKVHQGYSECRYINLVLMCVLILKDLFFTVNVYMANNVYQFKIFWNTFRWGASLMRCLKVNLRRLVTV